LIFSFKGYEQQIIDLNDQRNSKGSKVVPEQVLRQMFESYEPVKLEEGFSEVIYIDFLWGVWKYK
jgi:hypothetical protein